MNIKEHVTHMNLKELAEATYTQQQQTISRFCKKLGEKNFNDFRVHFGRNNSISNILYLIKSSIASFLQDSSKK